jgi:DHA2 family multidrug resistance protein
MALNGVLPSELRYASGLFNLMRNLGGAIGIAVVNTWLIDFTRIHTATLSAGLGEQPDKGIGAIQALAQRAQGWTTDAGRAIEMAQSVVGRVVGREAATLAFADTYRLMAFVFLAALVIVPFAKPAPYTQGPPPSDH